jgi:hypothetical protein
VAFDEAGVQSYWWRRIGPIARPRTHMRSIIFLILMILAGLTAGTSAAGTAVEPAWPADGQRRAQYAAFPVPTSEYEPVEGGIWATFAARVKRDPFNAAATAIFGLAIIHTFSAGTFNKLAHKFEKRHHEVLAARGGGREVSFWATVCHFLGEVEAIFGIWVIALAGAATWFHSWEDFSRYLHFDRHFTEPIFVVIIMAVASSRPVLLFAEALVARVAGLGRGTPGAWWIAILVITPLLGSLITEPAAITIGALLLAKKFYRLQPGPALAYATIGLLFVNISVGGTLTHFAAPPVLMVAGEWGWDTAFMLGNFGWKAAAALTLATVLHWLFFRREFVRLARAVAGGFDGSAGLEAPDAADEPVPWWVVLVHLLFLAWTVACVHDPVLVVGGFLFFLAFVMATEHHQSPISLRGPMLVGFFLAGLIIHGGCQSWWIEPVIKTLPPAWLMFGATLLTAFNDNAAITYLAAQVPDISEAAKVAVVAGAVTGGGLTVIANAPNPAGQSILSRFFRGGVSPAGLAAAALVPTAVVYAAFVWLPGFGGPPAPAKPTAAAVAPAQHP